MKLRHDTDNFWEVFGITEERFMELHRAVKHMMAEGDLLPKKSQEIEYLQERFKPIGEAEYFLMGMFYAIAVSKTIEEMMLKILPAELLEHLQGHHGAGHTDSLRDFLKGGSKKHES